MATIVTSHTEQGYTLPAQELANEQGAAYILHRTRATIQALLLGLPGWPEAGIYSAYIMYLEPAYLGRDYILLTWNVTTNTTVAHLLVPTIDQHFLVTELLYSGPLGITPPAP